ncbi:solute carrier family 15 member 1b isoform X3 [Oncorhynchus tshawytscha]|uniref:Solute carrier family 15 member 1 n=1 Tax=Oncorhynchus tshawytscha TaxID=74940 RepID=A0AAZ3SEI2_ONCTS|nr:solute carrier family 15 member 1b isoform X3 [Oncorhynchus tshawytscha]
MTDKDIDVKKPKRKVDVCGYPLSIFFIVVNEFCERFSYYGMRAVLVLYFRYFLKWDDDLATSIYHTFIALCYLTPILGAIVADSWLGKFKTIVYLSIVYTVGQVVMAVSAIHDITDTDRDGTPDNMTFHVAMSMVGLFLIALGTGGIKPCVAAFGGDQFEDHQEKQRSTFFSIFYLSINAGSLLSTVITPILRGQECGIHSQQKCYPLAFGVPAALMVVALIVFIMGSGMYNKTAPKGNIMLEVCKCIGFAIKNRFRHRSKTFPKREHWMDWANEKYDKLLVAQVKMVLKVLFLYIPLPMFWTLFDQQGSRWTLQATTMDGNFGILMVQPDQMQTVNPILILALVPIMDSLVYPLIKKCHLNFTPLKRMTVGMLIAALAFVAAALLQLQIDQTLPKLPKGVAGQVKFLNLNQAPLTVTINGTADVSVPAHQVNTGGYLTFDKPVRVVFNKNTSAGTDLTLMSQTRRTALVSPTLDMNLVYDLSKKPDDGMNAIRFVNGLGSPLNVTLGVGDIAPLSVSNYSLVPQGKAEFTIMNRGGASCLYSKELGFGSAFTLVIPSTFNIGSPDCWQAIQVVEDIKPNTIHMGWQIPQYFLMTAGEVVFSVTGLEFSYSQAPSNMKSVLQAGWLFTVAVGNIIVLIVAEAAQLPDQWAEYILFASLLVVVCIVFAVMSYFYTYTDPAEIEAQFRQPEHEPEEKKRDRVEMERKDSDCSKGSKGSDKKKRDSVVEQHNQDVKQSKM